MLRNGENIVFQCILTRRHFLLHSQGCCSSPQVMQGCRRRQQARSKPANKQTKAIKLSMRNGLRLAKHSKAPQPSHKGCPKFSWRLAKSVRSVWKPVAMEGDFQIATVKSAQLAAATAPSKVNGASPDDSCVSSCIAALRKGSGKLRTT